jgi:hypothetical protein
LQPQWQNGPGSRSNRRTVGAQIGVGCQELLYQIAIGAVDLDTVCTGFNRTLCRMAEILHGRLDLFVVSAALEQSCMPVGVNICWPGATAEGPLAAGDGG